MNKLRYFLIKTFCTTYPRLRIHRSVLWGFPSIAVFFTLFALWENQAMFDNKPVFLILWYVIMWIFGIISALYLYFIFVHFRMFPITNDEFKRFVEDGYFEADLKENIEKGLI